MFYGSCATTCPALIDELAHVIAQLPARRTRPVRVLLVSFDPARDTPAALAALARAHRLDARWTLAAAVRRRARALAGVLGIKYRRLGSGAFYHTTAITLVDPAGRPLARATTLADFAPLVAALTGP